MKDKPMKAQIRRNKPKIKLGNLGRNLLVRGEDKRKFEEFKMKVLREIRPATSIEIILCEKFISAAWRHRRLLAIERNLLSSKNVPDEPVDDPYSLEYYDRDRRSSKIKRRMRNIKKLRFDDPEIKYLLKQEVALQKNMLKILEMIRAEQARR